MDLLLVAASAAAALVAVVAAVWVVPAIFLATLAAVADDPA